MGIYDGIYLYTDMDGTLLDDDKNIPEVNLRALKRFTDEGGMFGAATGRSPHNLSFFPEVLPLTAPSILDNGGVLYDVLGRKYIECTYIPKQKSMELVYRLLEISPEASVQMYTREAIYQANLSPDRWVDPLIAKEGIIERPMRPEDVPGEWIKIVLCLPEEKLHKTLDMIDLEAMRKDFAAVVSGKIYFEFLSPGRTKGSGVASMRKKNPSIKKILAIGDYYNDMDMLEQADIAGVPENAPDDIKATADYIVCDNNQGAVADFLRAALGLQI